jgi:molybdate transport system ATP-binding protein
MTIAVRGTARVGGFTLDIDVAVGAETVAIVGDNGVGKTTLLKVMAGVLALESGRMTLDGVAVDEPTAGVFVTPRHRGVAMLFQDPLLFPHLSVIDNVAFGLRRRGVGRAAARDEASRALERLSAVDLAERGVGTLSGGQAQRVALARALVCNPRVILLDEPFSSLDRHTRMEFRTMLARDFAALQIPRLVVTHDDADIAALCSRTIEVTRTSPNGARASGEGGLGG